MFSRKAAKSAKKNNFITRYHALRGYWHFRCAALCLSLWLCVIFRIGEFQIPLTPFATRPNGLAGREGGIVRMALQRKCNSSPSLRKRDLGRFDFEFSDDRPRRSGYLQVSIV